MVKQNSDQSGVPPTQLVVMAAGMGSRYGGLKQIDPIGPGGENILDYSVFDAIRGGFTKVIFVLRHEIEDLFRDKVGRKIEKQIETAYVFQELDNLPPGFTVPDGRTKPWGTAHAVLCAREEVSAPFAAINADDYYGQGAFALLNDHLRSAALTKSSGNYCLIGFPIGNTLSEHGFVSRGVCQVTSEGNLADIVEHTRIERTPEGIKSSGDEDYVHILPIEAIVSMNLWGFTPDFMGHLATGFTQFLQQSGNDLRSECYLPFQVNRLIKTEQATVKVLPTDEQWFGVTYQEDKAVAKNTIEQRINDGQYPSRLWH